MSSSSLSAPCRAVGTPGRQVRHKRSWHAHEWDDREELLAATFGFLSRNEVPALLKEGSVLTLYCFEVLSWRRNTPLLRHVLEHQGLICSRSPDNRSQDFFRASKPVIGTFLLTISRDEVCGWLCYNSFEDSCKYFYTNLRTEDLFKLSFVRCFG